MIHTCEGSGAPEDPGVARWDCCKEPLSSTRSTQDVQGGPVGADTRQQGPGPRVGRWPTYLAWGASLLLQCWSTHQKQHSSRWSCLVLSRQPATNTHSLSAPPQRDSVNRSWASSNHSNFKDINRTKTGVDTGSTH